MSLMLVYGELETIARLSECFSLLINGGFFIWCPYFESPSFLGRNWNLREMKRRSLVVIAGDPPPGDSSSVPINLCL